MQLACFIIVLYSNCCYSLTITCSFDRREKKTMTFMFFAKFSPRPFSAFLKRSMRLQRPDCERSQSLHDAAKQRLGGIGDDLLICINNNNKLIIGPFILQGPEKLSRPWERATECSGGP